MLSKQALVWAAAAVLAAAYVHHAGVLLLRDSDEVQQNVLSGFYTGRRAAEPVIVVVGEKPRCWRAAAARQLSAVAQSVPAAAS